MELPTENLYASAPHVASTVWSQKPRMGTHWKRTTIICGETHFSRASLQLWRRAETYRGNPPARHHSRHDIYGDPNYGFLEETPVERQDRELDRRDYSGETDFGNEDALEENHKSVWRCYPDVFAQTTVHHYSFVNTCLRPRERQNPLQTVIVKQRIVAKIWWCVSSLGLNGKPGDVYQSGNHQPIIPPEPGFRYSPGIKTKSNGQKSKHPSAYDQSPCLGLFAGRKIDARWWRREAHVCLCSRCDVESRLAHPGE